MTPADQEEDAADALAKQVHAASIGEAVIEFARMTIAANRSLDATLIMRCLLAETLAAMAFDYGLEPEDAMRDIQTMVQYRIARREEAETPAPTPDKPAAMH
jgi:hypothetical protein